MGHSTTYHRRAGYAMGCPYVVAGEVGRTWEKNLVGSIFFISARENISRSQWLLDNFEDTGGWCLMTRIYLRVEVQDTVDVVHPKTYPFSTLHIIWVNCKYLSQSSQPMSLLFSYLDSVRHSLFIELCREQVFLYGSRENQPKVFSLWFFTFFNNTHFHIDFTWNLTILWLA